MLLRARGVRHTSRMRLVIAPDKFAGTLTALQAAQAIAAGWRAIDTAADLSLVPLSDGGPGFVDALHEAIGGDLLPAEVTGPAGDRVPAHLLRVGDTAYLESAQACGLHLVPDGRADPATATTYGVGELIAAAVDNGATRIVVGLGGSATNDGGAGALAALGATAAPGEATLRGGPAGLPALTGVDLVPARRRVAGVELVAATDVDNPLTGLEGASAVFGPQKGADRAQVLAFDAALEHLAALAGAEVAASSGAGAAGGLGYALLVLGARRTPGLRTVVDAVHLDERIAAAELVVTGEGAFDSQSLRGKVPHGVARAAAEHGAPCVVLAGRVEVGRREMATSGVTEAYALIDPPGSQHAALTDPAGELRLLAARVARRWARPTSGPAAHPQAADRGA